jgi:hypothetical protein
VTKQRERIKVSSRDFERTSEEDPDVEQHNTLDGVKYRLIMEKVLGFERFWIYRIDDLVDSRTKRVERIREIQAEIEGLDFEQFKATPPTYYPSYSSFSVQNIIDAQQTMLTELTTWLNDPWGREGLERPREYKKI